MKESLGTASVVMMSVYKSSLIVGSSNNISVK